jgi:hypothetical protein
MWPGNQHQRQFAQCLKGLEAAKKMGLVTLALTGKTEGRLPPWRFVAQCLLEQHGARSGKPYSHRSCDLRAGGHQIIPETLSNNWFQGVEVKTKKNLLKKNKD